MRAAGISPAATAAFFERIGGKEEGREARAMSWLSSHPLSAERRRRFTAAVKPGAAYRPALDQAQRSEEHTSELQSLMRISYAVFCLNKKKTQIQTSSTHRT